MPHLKAGHHGSFQPNSTDMHALRLLMSLRKERWRIRRELTDWQAGHPQLHRLVGGWWGLVFTVVVLAGSGWIEPVRLGNLLRLAVTPLAVFWVVEAYAGRRDSSVAEDHDDEERRWSRTVMRLARLAGMVAVVGILILEAFPSGGWAREVLTPAVLLWVCMAITNAIANTVGTEPPRFLVEDLQPFEFNRRVASATLVDVPVAAFITLILVLGILQLMTYEFMAWARLDLLDVVDPLWVPVVTVFWLYRWLTLAKWGHGLGGRFAKVRLRDHNGESPGWVRVLLRATSDAVLVGIVFAFVHVAPSSRALGLGTAGLVIGAYVLSPHHGRGLTDVLIGTQYKAGKVIS